MADLINVGLTGLRAHQVALSVTGNNVANTNTPGYSRQEAVFVDNPSLLSGAGFQGQGVSIETVRRITQSFVVDQVRSDTSVYNERNALMTQASNVDNLLASSTTGLTPAMSRFFQAFQSAAEDPTSIPQRQLLLTQTEGLISRFHAIDSRLAEQLTNIDQELQAAVSTINSLAESLANLNQQIAIAVGAGQGDMPNNLMDARDETLRKLSEMVSVSVTEANDSRISVFIGKGQPLVIGNSYSRMSTVASASESGKLDIALTGSGTQQVVTNDLTGGKIGGLIEFRDNNLTQARNELGRIALVLADTVNHQHSLGMDLENNLGGLYFNDINSQTLARSRVLANGTNTPPNDQVLRIEINEPSELLADDYELRFDGPTDTDFNIVSLRTDEVVLRSSLHGVFPAAVQLPGFELQFESGTFKRGDRFTLMPTRTGASDLRQIVDRVEELSFASPIRADASLGNTGNARISLGQMLDIENPLTNQTIDIFSTPHQLSPNLGIQFITDTVFEVVDLTDPANPVPMVPPFNNQRYNLGVNNTLFTSDPGQTVISAAGPDMLVLPAPVASPGPYLNGYGAQTLTFLTRDLATGVITSQAINLAADSSASDMAAAIRAVPGVQVTSYTQARLSNFTDNGDATPLGIEINGEVLTVTAPDVAGPDTLAELINNNSALQLQNIFAVSDGVTLTVRSTSGADLEIVVTGSGDSVDVSKIDPYSPGAPVLSTQTVASGQGIAVGGALDVTLSEGVSFTASVASIFEQAPVGRSTYLGFQFEIQGEPQAGDRFSIRYNLNGISDNRNARAIAALETQSQIAGGVMTYGEAYSQIVEEIGTVTNRARLDTEASKALLDQSTDYRESIAGVNLDEEAGRLIQFQSAYNASAQVVAIARELFDTLLNTFR